VASPDGCWAERVAWFGSSRLDLHTGLAAVPAGGVAACNHATIDGLGCILAPPGGFSPNGEPVGNGRSRHKVGGRTLARDGRCGCMWEQQPRGCGRRICSGQM
jgi:hypothetical protein